MSNWWEAQRDYASGLGIEVVSEVFDKQAQQRVYGAPVYDFEGNMRCRACGGFMARAMDRRGTGIASCSNTGCEAHGFEFAEGSLFSNPGRVRA